MKIERTNNELIIRLSDRIDPDGVQRLINFLRYQEATIASKAKQKAIDSLASEVNKSWWEGNKDRFLKL